MTQLPTGPGEGDPDATTRIVKELLRLQDSGEIASLKEFCSRFPEALRSDVRLACEEILSLRAMIHTETPKLTAWPSPVGKQIGDFRIVEEIGRGGMGVVYLAEQLSLKREVALKVLPPDATPSRQRIQRFEREAEAAARLNHDGIVRIFQYGSDDGVGFLAMEHLKGSSLFQLLQQAHVESKADDPHPLTQLSAADHPRRVAQVVAQVAGALHYAHEQGVIHRDIKPQNILIDDACRPRILDFGLAKLVDYPSITRSNEFPGTPYYMSPEQALARRVPIDHRTDVFSLGVVFYEMLSHRRPFEGSSSHQVLYEIAFKDPPPLSTLNPNVPRDLVVLCAKALEKNPERRFQTAQELADELDRFLAGQPIASRPPSPLQRLGRRVKRHRGPLLAGALILLALLVGTRLPVDGPVQEPFTSTESGIHTLAYLIDTTDLALFNGPDESADQIRRSSLASSVRNAVPPFEERDKEQALAALNDVVVLVDGQGYDDVMHPCDEKVAYWASIAMLIREVSMW